MPSGYPCSKRVMAPKSEPAPAFTLPPPNINLTFDDVKWEHVHLNFPWEIMAKVLCSRIKQTDEGHYLYVILSDIMGVKMEAICYENFVDHFNNQLQCGTSYLFKRIWFEPADQPLPFNLAIQSEFVIILRRQTEIHTLDMHTNIPRLPLRFTPFSTVYGLQNNMLADIIGMVVYVSNFMYKKTLNNNVPCRDVAVINSRREIIFVRIWGRHVGKGITCWRQAEYGMWTIAATLLEIKHDDGGLATIDESHIVFRQPSYELEAFRATLLSARMSLSQQVRRAVKQRNKIAP